MRPLFAAILLCAAPAFAAGLSSRPYEMDQPDAVPALEGVYAGVAGGGELLILGGNSYWGFGVEGRLGYSFSPSIQLYLSGAYDNASVAGGPNFTAEQIAVYIQYHLLLKPAIMVFARGGVGVGLSSKFVLGSTAAGLAQGGGIGVEIRLSPGFYLAPELFYRGSTLSAQGVSDSYQAVGLQLGVIYY